MIAMKKLLCLILAAALLLPVYALAEETAIDPVGGFREAYEAALTELAGEGFELAANEDESEDAFCYDLLVDETWLGRIYFYDENNDAILKTAIAETVPARMGFFSVIQWSEDIPRETLALVVFCPMVAAIRACDETVSGEEALEILNKSLNDRPGYFTDIEKNGNTYSFGSWGDSGEYSFLSIKLNAE